MENSRIRRFGFSCVRAVINNLPTHFDSHRHIEKPVFIATKINLFDKIYKHNLTIQVYTTAVKFTVELNVLFET